MDIPTLLTQASQEATAEKQRDFIKKNAPGDTDPGDLLWQAFRAGTFLPAERPFWWTMANATRGFSADDVLTLLAAAAQGPADAAAASSQWCNLANVFTEIDRFIDGSGDEAAFIAGHARVGGYIGSILRCILAHRGHEVPADPALLPDLARTVVCGSGDDHRSKQFAQFFSRLSAVYPSPAWEDALKARLFEHLTNPSKVVSGYQDLTVALEAMTDAELVQIALPHCPDSDRNRMFGLLLARRATIVPELMKLAEHWLANREAKNRSGRAINILVSTLLRIQLDADLPLLPEKYDLLIQHAMWDREGPLQQLLGHFSTDRLEPLMFPTRSGKPHGYFHHCPTEKVKQHMVDQIRAQEGRARWEITNEAPSSIIKIGAPMLPLIHEVMRVGGGLHRHVFIRCLKNINDPTSIPVLLRCLDDTGPRVKTDHNTGRVRRVKDIPEIAAAALISMARTMPESAMLPALAAALADDSASVRQGAAATLASMPATPAVIAAARAALPVQTHPPIRWLLGHTVRRGDVPEVLAAARAVVLPEATVEATDAVLEVAWKNNEFDSFWQAHSDHSAAILVRIAERYREALVTRYASYGLSEALYRAAIHCSDHPAVVAILIDLLDHFPATKGYEALQVLTKCHPTIPALPAAFLARCTDEARPAVWKTVLSYPTDWGLDRDDLLLDGLTDPSPEIRQRCAARLTKRPLTDLSRVYPLLFSRSQDLRFEAATLLASFTLKASIPHLLAAQKKERAGRVKAALAEALAVYSPADIAAAPALTPPKRTAVRKRRVAKKIATQPTSAPKARKEWTDWLAHTPLTRPSQTTWAQLTSQIEHLPPSPIEVDLLQTALSAWTDGFRVAPTAWIAAASRKKVPPAHWHLARTISYSRFGSQGSMTPARLKWIFTSPLMSKITRVSLTGLTHSKPRQAILDHLASSTHLSGLQQLHLSTCWLTRDFIDVLLAATHLSSLTSLGLSNNMLSPANGLPGIEALLEAPHLQGLQRLTAHQAGGQHFIDALKTSAGMPQLEEVVMSYGHNILASSIEAVAGIKRPWRRIVLGGRGLTTATALVYADSDNLTGLAELNLTGNIGLEGVMALLDSKKLPALKELRLSYCGIQDTDAAAIEAHPRLKTLDRFYCSSHALKNKSIDTGAKR